jgi:hypothetical protein
MIEHMVDFGITSPDRHISMPVTKPLRFLSLWFLLLTVNSVRFITLECYNDWGGPYENLIDDINMWEWNR